MKFYQKYADLSKDFFWSEEDLIERKKKNLFLIILGPNGSGKTTLAKILESKMKNCVYISYDRFYKDNYNNLLQKFTELISSLETDKDVILDGFYGIEFKNVDKIINDFNYDLHIVNKKIWNQHKIIDNLIDRLKTIFRTNIDILKYIKLYEPKVSDLDYYKKKINDVFHIKL